MKVLGLCFLIYDKINHEELWYNWLRNVDKKKYKIYIHYKNDMKLKYFEKYKLDNCIQTKYCDITIVHAHNILFTQAYKDGCQKIISLSQACIPLKSFDYVYNFLTKDNFSHFNIVPNQKGVFPRCDNIIKQYGKDNIQKTSNWFILDKNIGIILCSKKLDEINNVWKNIYCPEEHFFISEVFKNNLTSEIITTPNLASGATTFTNWNDMDYPYQDHYGLKTYGIITKQEIDYLLKQPCLFGRKFNPDCKVIENNIPLLFNKEINQLSLLSEYLTERIC